MDEDVLRDADAAMKTIRRMRLGLARFFRSLSESGAFSMPQYNLLTVLEEKGECTMGQLAAGLGITMGAVTSLVDRLIHAGLVERERSAEDRRVVKVRQTDKGRDMLHEVLRRSRKHVGGVLETATAAERRTFLTVLGKLADKAHELGEAAGKGGV